MEKIQLQHPDGKNAVRIDKQKYDVIFDAIIQVLTINGEIPHKTLSDGVVLYLKQQKMVFEGSVAWYTESVKLDMEAKQLVLRRKEKSRWLFSVIK